MGIDDADLDEYGYVYATIPSNTNKTVPVICFCAHVDTAPDCPGTGVKPIVHKNYDGKNISFFLMTRPRSFRQMNIRIFNIRSVKILLQHPALLCWGLMIKLVLRSSWIWQTILFDHPDLKHGTIKILFTPDEEIGRGVDKVDLKKLGADFGYTLDGGERGAYRR